MDTQQIVEAEPQVKHAPFGEKFAYLAVSVTIVYTYAIINVMFYL